MATKNDITGDRLINTPKTSPTLTQKQRGLPYMYDDIKFDVYLCDSCHIKVSTSNGLCPCCGKELG